MLFFSLSASKMNGLIKFVDISVLCTSHFWEKKSFYNSFFQCWNMEELFQVCRCTLGQWLENIFSWQTTNLGKTPRLMLNVLYALFLYITFILNAIMQLQIFKYDLSTSWFLNFTIIFIVFAIWLKYCWMSSVHGKLKYTNKTCMSCIYMCNYTL